MRKVGIKKAFANDYYDVEPICSDRPDSEQGGTSGTEKTLTRASDCLGPQVSGPIAQTNPGTEREGVDRMKYAKNNSQPGSQTQKTFPVRQTSGLITQTSLGIDRGGRGG